MKYQERSFDLTARARNVLGRVDASPDEESMVRAIEDELLGIWLLSAAAARDTENEFSVGHHVMNVFGGLKERGLTDD